MDQVIVDMMMFVEDGRGAGEGIVTRCETVLAELTKTVIFRF